MNSPTTLPCGTTALAQTTARGATAPQTTRGPQALRFRSGGFITTSDGNELVFAIFSADQRARAKISRAERERPRGGRSWNTRAKKLQESLLDRWGQVYGS